MCKATYKHAPHSSIIGQINTVDADEATGADGRSRETAKAPDLLLLCSGQQLVIHSPHLSRCNEPVGNKR
jgi:hypothetical protein